MTTEHVRDSPSIARRYCPGCEPDADPNTEILDIIYCTQHTPSRRGVEDETVASDSYPSGNGDVGGEDNRRWCEMFHHGTPNANARTTNHHIKSS